MTCLVYKLSPHIRFEYSLFCLFRFLVPGIMIVWLEVRFSTAHRLTAVTTYLFHSYPVMSLIVKIICPFNLALSSVSQISVGYPCLLISPDAHFHFCPFSPRAAISPSIHLSPALLSHFFLLFSWISFSHVLWMNSMAVVFSVPKGLHCLLSLFVFAPHTPFVSCYFDQIAVYRPISFSSLFPSLFFPLLSRLIHGETEVYR